MSFRLYLLAAAGVLLAGCASVPDHQPAPASPAPASPSAPPAVRASRSPVEGLEAGRRERAKAFENERNWADALVEWELLALLRPDSQEYREALAATRSRILTSTAGLLRSAEFARKQGNLDQATLLYLRVLNLDRGNVIAAQALREIETERAQRAYFTRPPRGNY